MTLAEKLLSLRTGQGLSQEDLAEKMEVSRQSVSKWETGQSVPDLDKIIKLADLFGVTVDELVREGERPQPPEPPQPRVVYVARQLAPTQIIGAVLLALGMLGVIFGAAVSGNTGTYTALTGGGMVVLGLPFLLSRKHPFLIAGWVVLAVSCLFLNPYTSVARWGLLGGIRYLYFYFTISEMRCSIYLFAALVGIVRGALTLALLYFTWRTWKNRNDSQKDG